ncbi:HAMP domain-containing sensor histidine kinase [Ligilactobacillus saerimneri]|uniref:Signal transduction histidine-protein kinase ArlS n=1 Tax=Ligilactobacillus saerimneri 30a TaxID=1227363 RepID=M5J3Z4_9LACO|nr:HAMP domain-containing histidine kinase [Ligilactobacillus saerimneri]EKW98448.1 Sensor protein [Ligilactobacillus saerimneri 30a]
MQEQEILTGSNKPRKPAKRFVSIRFKWSIGTAIGVLILFAVFALLLYNSFTGLLLQQEQQYTQEALTTAVSRLTNENKELNAKQVNRIFDQELVNDAIQQSRPLYHDNVLISLSRKNLGISVYDPQGKTVYSSRNVPVSFKKSYLKSNNNNSLDNVRKFDGVPVLIMNKPVRSKKSHQIIGYVQVTNSLVEYSQTAKSLLTIFILFGIIAIVASILLGYILSDWLLSPISEINETIDKISSTEHDDPFSNVRVPEFVQNDELSHLADLFNEMLDQMEGYIEQQQQFVEDVSHELRTPVAIIQGHLELLNRWGKDDPEVLDESIQASLQEIKRMKSLVQEMLDLSRAEQVEIKFKNEITDAHEVGLQVFDNIKMIHPDFTLVLDDNLRGKTSVKIYRNHLEQLLIILLDNAIKYSTDRKEVHLTLDHSSRDVEFVVQDFGEGISEADIKKIFNRFYRVDKARSRDKGGNGLGLAIAKRLIEGYKGSLKVESAVGQGSLFRVSLPLALNDSSTAKPTLTDEEGHDQNK